MEMIIGLAGKGQNISADLPIIPTISAHLAQKISFRPSPLFNFLF